MESSRFIYFLIMEKKAPPWLELMTRYFYRLKIGTTTITCRDLKHLPVGKKTHLIISESTLTAKKRLAQVMEGYLGFALENNLFPIHHISSFNDYKYQNKRDGYYYFYPLPFIIAPFCIRIAQKFSQNPQKEAKWERGERARLQIN